MLLKSDLSYNMGTIMRPGSLTSRFINNIWPINVWVDRKNAKLRPCEGCGQKNYTSTCQDSTSGLHYRLEPDEVLRKKLFRASIYTLLVMPLFIIKNSILLTYESIALLIFYQRKSTYLQGLKQSALNIFILSVTPLLWAMQIITAFLGAITPFKNGPKDARKLYSFFERCIFGVNYWFNDLRPLKPNVSPYRSTSIFVAQTPNHPFYNISFARNLLSHFMPVNDWRHVNQMHYNCANCGRQVRTTETYNLHDEAAKAYYLNEPDAAIRFKLGLLAIFSTPISAYKYLLHVTYSFLKLITLYDFRNKENTWNDAFTKTAVDLTRIAAGPIILPAMQITATLGVVTPFKNGVNDARKIYAVCETLLWGYDGYRVAHCFMPIYADTNEVPLLTSPRPSM